MTSAATEIDVALVQIGETLTLHEATCPQARQAAAAGHQVLTMLGVKADTKALNDYDQHSCCDGLIGRRSH